MAENQGKPHCPDEDSFTPDPGIYADDLPCGICGDRMDVTRNVMGPRSWAGAMSGAKTPHDCYSCPNTEERWHIQARLLKRMMTDTPSPSLAAMFEKDLCDVIKRRVKSKEFSSFG